MSIVPGTTQSEAPTGVLGLLSELIRSRLVTATAITIAVSLTAGPWAVDQFLGGYVDSYLDIREAELTSTSEAADIRAELDVLRRDLEYVELQVARQADVNARLEDALERSHRTTLAVLAALGAASGGPAGVEP